MANIAPGANAASASKRTYDEIDAAILDAAIEVLFERGGIELTVADVAKRAGTTTGALYSHFQDREGLLTAAYRERLDRGRKAPSSLVKLAAAVFSPEPDHLEQSLAMQLEMLTVAGYKERMATIEAFVASQHSDELRRSMRVRAREIRETLAAYVQASQNAGITRSDLDAEAIAITWNANVLGHALLTSIAPELYTPSVVGKHLAVWDLTVHQFDIDYVQSPETVATLTEHTLEVVNEEWRKRHATM
jgi:AcrR family transcriptional regulator